MAKGLKYTNAAYEEMGPASLAFEPAALAGDGPTRDPDWPDLYQYVESRMKALRLWRLSWWAHWASLADYILPKRYHWLITPNRTARGSNINTQIIDCTATLAQETCASGLWSALTPPSRPWLKLDKLLPWVELDAEGVAWLEEVESRLYTVLGQSNFYTAMAQFFQDVTVFGTAVVLILEDSEDAIRCYVPCAGEYFLGAGGRQSVDTFYREFVFTVAQVVDMFGMDSCPREIREQWAEGNTEQEYVICHAIEPNAPITRHGASSRTGPLRPVPEDFTYREIYWLKGQMATAPLSKRGFVERPVMVGRWSVTSNDPYGRSPGMNALGDVKQVQLATRRAGEFIEKLVRPPMGADPELKNEPSSIIPGNITYVNTSGGKKGFFPLFEVNPAALQPLVDNIEKVNQRIERAFYVDVFMAISRMEGVQPRNELELSKRDLERLQSLGPFVALFENEVATPAIQRVLSIMDRRKMLPPRPKSLQGMPLNVKYDSIIRQAQRAAQTVAMKDALSTAGAMSAAAKAAGVPDPLRIFKLDTALRKYCDLSNFPVEALFTEDEVAKKDKAQSKMTQQMMANQQKLQATMAGVQAAKTLSDTPLGQGSALDAMTGGGGGP